MKGTSLAFALLITLTACGESESPAPPPPAPAPPASAPEPAPPPPAAPPAAPPPATPPPATPSPAAGISIPVPEGNLRGDAAKGAIIYTTYCANCHGMEGKGDGPGAVALNPKPADHTSVERMGPLSDADIYTVIYGGGIAVGKSPLMTPWGQILTDQQIRDVLAHVRTLSGT